MEDIEIRFEMTDALIARAIREDSVATLRDLFKLRDLLIIAASTALFAWAVATHSHWIWWIAGLPIAIVALILLVWLAAYAFLPGLAASRTAHLPHRTVTVALTDPGLAFHTATERLDVDWSEVKAIKRLANFWIVCLKAGTQIPIPLEQLSEDARRMFAAKVPDPGPRKS